MSDRWDVPDVSDAREPGGWAPTVAPSRRSRSIGAAMLLGVGRALQQIYDEPPPEPGAVVFEVDDDEPDRSGPIWIEFDPDDPTRTIVHVTAEP